MYKKSEVGPDLMNITYFIIFNYYFHTHLAPGRYPNYVSNIPLFGMFNNFSQFLIPIFNGCYMATRLIKTLKPERTFFCQYSAEVTGIPPGFYFLQISSSTNH